MTCQKSQTSDVRFPHAHELTIVAILLLPKFLATIVLSISILVVAFGMVMEMAVHVCAVLRNRRVRACSWCAAELRVVLLVTVSYTHLTLPTIYSV